METIMIVQNQVTKLRRGFILASALTLLIVSHSTLAAAGSADLSQESARIVSQHRAIFTKPPIGAKANSEKFW